MQLFSSIRRAFRQITGKEKRVLEALHSFYVADLRKACTAEREFLKVMPTDPPGLTKEMKNALKSHFQQTRDHLLRMGQLLQAPAGPNKKERCDAMRELLAESKNLMSSSLLWLCHCRMSSQSNEVSQEAQPPLISQNPSQAFQPWDDVLLHKIPLKRWNY